MARYDFGLSDAEFEELTPAEFWALGKRRNVGIKYDRFAAALAAAAVYNVNRGEDSPIITAMDFVRDDEKQAELERKRNWGVSTGHRIQDLKTTRPQRPQDLDLQTSTAMIHLR